LIDSGRIREKQHRIARSAEVHSLILRWKKTIAPESREQRLIRIDSARLRNQHNERGKILVLAAETVGHPGTETGTPRLLTAGLNESNGRIVIDRFRVRGSDNRDVIHDLSVVGKQFAEPRPGFTVLTEFENRLRHRQRTLARGHPGDPLTHPYSCRKLLSLQFRECRLVIEKIDLRWRSGLMQVDDAFRFRSEMRQPGQAARGRSVREEVRIQERAERDDAD